MGSPTRLRYASQRTPVSVFNARYVEYAYTMDDHATIVRFHGCAQSMKTEWHP